MRVILLFLARVSVSFRRLSNLNPTAEPITKASKQVTGLDTMLGSHHKEKLLFAYHSPKPNVDRASSLKHNRRLRMLMLIFSGTHIYKLDLKCLQFD